MKTQIFVDSKFAFLDDFIRQIPDNFSTIGTEIYKGRNEVHQVNVQGQVLIIKYFRKITLANRYIYAAFRKSKAQRAFEHSSQLCDMGIKSPEPVAFINCYRNGMLSQNYYVSLFTPYKPLRELLEKPLTETLGVLQAFARFTYKIQRLGVFHEDYTIDNVLYLFRDNKFEFTLIDNNRMRFSSYTYWKAIRNLKRLNLTSALIGIFAEEYAREAKVSDIKTLNHMVGYRCFYVFGISIRRRLKSFSRLLLGK